jgi:peptidoglycan/LPS O-acetylase OafA/YrhL
MKHDAGNEPLRMDFASPVNLSCVKTPTIASILRDNNNKGPGFDFLRLSLALLVLFWHCFALSHGISWSIQTLHGPWRGIIFSLVPSFFALSGFLVAGSMMRIDKLSTFLLFRILRIVPALAMETVLSAFLLGTVVTTLPLKDYFQSPAFLDYMLNILGMVHFQLPGVFRNNPWPEYVNYSLWTVPAELGCYIVLSILIFAGLAKERTLLLVLFLLTTVGLAFMEKGGFDTFTSSVVLSRPMLICCFVAGNLFYLWKDRIPLTPVLFAISIVGFCISVYFFYPIVFSIGAVSIAYITVYIGLSRIPKVPLLMSGDYSYGTYLYAYPIQQTVVWIFPNFREFYFVFLVATPVTLLFAAFSWHCVEKPILKLKNKFMPRPA